MVLDDVVAETHDVWNGSDIIGGCGRAARSRLDWPAVRDVVERVLESPLKGPPAQ